MSMKKKNGQLHHFPSSRNTKSTIQKIDNGKLTK